MKKINNDGKFVDENLQKKTAGTVISADWLNTVQDELVALATMNGDQLGSASDQAKTAIRNKLDTLDTELKTLITKAQSKADSNKTLFDTEFKKISALITTVQTKADSNESRHNDRIGEIITTISSTTPHGCLPCDGGKYNKMDYPSLSSLPGEYWGGSYFDLSDNTAWGKLLTFNSNVFMVPKLSDIFLRMTGTNTGVLGSYQVDAFQGHWHNVSKRNQSENPVNSSNSGRGFLLEQWNTISGTSSSVSKEVRDAVSDNTNSPPRTASETRPKNVAVNFWIRYK